MAAPDLTPIILNDVVAVFGADNYEKHISKLVLTPTSTIVKWRGLTPAAKHNFPTDPDWVADVDYAQDWATANSFSRYLFENMGDAVTLSFKPKKPSTTGPTWTVTVYLTPGAIGGEVDTVAVASVSLGVSGQPVLTTA